MPNRVFAKPVQNKVLYRVERKHAMPKVTKTDRWQIFVVQGALAEAVTGIYAGFASIGSSPIVYKMCMSIGWNPFYQNERKTIEPWILHNFDKDFYGKCFLGITLFSMEGLLACERQCIIRYDSYNAHSKAPASSYLHLCCR